MEPISRSRRVSAAIINPGLDASEWTMLLRLLDECSEEQLDTIRGIVTSAKEEKVPTMPKAESPSPVKSTQLAIEIWDSMKGPEDPAASELPDETMERITMFAKVIRNRTLDEIASAVDKAYSKFTATVVDSIKNQKE